MKFIYVLPSNDDIPHTETNLNMAYRNSRKMGHAVPSFTIFMNELSLNKKYIFNDVNSVKRMTKEEFFNKYGYLPPISP